MQQERVQSREQTAGAVVAAAVVSWGRGNEHGQKREGSAGLGLHCVTSAGVWKAGGALPAGVRLGCELAGEDLGFWSSGSGIGDSPLQFRCVRGT